MQTIWKGTVSFGLVSIPVRLFAATEERDVSFRQVHRVDGGRVRYRRVCELDGEEVPYSEIAKGYEMPDGEMVVLDKEDFAALPLPSSKVIDVLQFVPAEHLDPLMMARSYYLSADGPGAKPYVLLRDALSRTDRVAIVKVALRNREQLAALSTRGDVLVLQTMLWPDEVRDATAVAPPADVAVRDQEVAMAESYIETLTGDFDPTQYTDEYRHALEELIASKAGEAPPARPAATKGGDGTVVDLMAALRASVEEAKARRAGGRAGTSAAASAAEPGSAEAAGSDDESATRRGGRSRAASSTAKSPRGAAARDEPTKSAAAAGSGSAGAQTAAQTAAGTAAGRGSPAKKTASKPASKAASKTASKPAGKTAGKTAGKAAAKTPTSRTASAKSAPRKSA